MDGRMKSETATSGPTTNVRPRPKLPSALTSHAKPLDRFYTEDNHNTTCNSNFLLHQQPQQQHQQQQHEQKNGGQRIQTGAAVCQSVGQISSLSCRTNRKSIVQFVALSSRIGRFSTSGQASVVVSAEAAPGNMRAGLRHRRSVWATKRKLGTRMRPTTRC